MGNWTIEGIEKLFAASDFSAESSLKKDLLKKIMPVREISLNELGKKAGRGNAEGKSRNHKTRERHAPSAEIANDAMNNDRPMLPKGR